MKARIFNIMQYERHPDTKEVLLTEDTIKVALAHKTIKRWAYIAHTEDVYSEKDYINDSSKVEGEKKPKHWHIVIEMGSNQAELDTIAKWFGIPSNFVDVAKGHGAFLDCVEYLTHENPNQQALGKHLYNDKEVHANFNFREELIKRQERKLKYGKDLSDKETMRLEVLLNGKTLMQCQAENPLLYSDDIEKLKKLRMQYICNQKPPKVRINYYICGRPGLGKSLLSRALARSLYPDMDDDDEIYFIVGAENSSFEGYDGQPVIIWDDMRAYGLLKILGSRGNVFNVLDTHPTKKRQNVKYGSINLINTINIINSVQDMTEFLDGLAGEYKTKTGEVIHAEDKGQIYRRIQFGIVMNEEDYDLYVNRGYWDGNDRFEEYYIYKKLGGNFQEIRKRFAGREELIKLCENKMVEDTIKKHDELIAREDELKDLTNEDIEFLKKWGIETEETKSQECEEDDIPNEDDIPDYDLFD